MSSTKKKIPPKIQKLIFVGVVIIVAIYLISQISNGSDFRAAKRTMEAGDYETAAEMFSKLGSYSDSDEYVRYCYALQAFSKENYSTAKDLFDALGGFQKSQKYASYCQGMILCASDNYWEAAEYFEKCLHSFLSKSAFLDSETQAKRCYYTVGMQLYVAKDYSTAAICFRRAGDYDNAEQLLAECNEYVNANK